MHEVAVFGVPDPIRAEEVLAVVVRRAGAEADPASIRAAAGEQLVRWKLPRYVVVRDQPLPRLPNGKIDQLELRASVDLASAWDATKNGA